MNDGPLPPFTQDELNHLSDRASQVIGRLRERVYAPNTNKQLELSFNVRSASEMVGRTEKAIREAEADGRLPQPDKDPKRDVVRDIRYRKSIKCARFSEHNRIAEKMIRRL